ncbi:hypothetical protein CRUP_025020 [Coryphaenoides rupestris]|nr:hypothetical protein CRUP_025020 [Coryphaenoides rupestris]
MRVDLRSLYPLAGLQHIKRVRSRKLADGRHSLEVLVCLVSDAPDVDLHTEPLISIDSLLTSNSVRLDGLGPPFLVQIPAHPPLTRPQFQVASKHWPTTFHEDKQVTVALRGELFSRPQKARMQGYMEAALAAARAGRRLGLPPVGAAMVDPKTERIIAVGHDCRDGNPLHHAVMVCIDLVARGQAGGAYHFDKYPACTATLSTISNNSKPASETPQTTAEVVEEEGQPYICTGYDLDVTWEPCVMCAMALVHSRIGRVFYGTASSDGALGTKYKIHTQRDLNDRFEVFKGVLSQQCQELHGLTDPIKH